MAVVPSFFVIGAFRSGTTMLYATLRRHPDVFLPLEKEPNWWAIDGNPDVDKVLASRSILSQEAYDRLYAPARPGQILADISPEYLANPWAAKRLSEVAPGAKLVAVLRNPIERAWSDYLLHVRDGNDTAPTFAAALDDADRRHRDQVRGADYVRSGMYHAQLVPYLERFDRSQIQIHLYDDLKADPEGVIHSILEFIGARTDLPLELADQVNASGVPSNRLVATVIKARAPLRRYVPQQVIEVFRPAWDQFLSRVLQRPELAPADRARLVAELGDDIERLAELLGRDLSHWTREA